MKILAIISGLDFRNHTRMSTLTAIHRLNPEMDILLFNSVRNYFVTKVTIPGLRFFAYHFWIFERIRKFHFLTDLEHLLRRLRWKYFFKKYDYIFIIDPNQYYLLPYINKKHKLVYLLRDPGILQNPLYHHYERSLIMRSNAILAISENLQTTYLKKYYNYQKQNVYLWSNAVDLCLWDHRKYPHIRKSPGMIVGMAGNLNIRTDLNLLKFLLKERPYIKFEIAGKLDLNLLQLKLWKELLEFNNLYYHGYVPFADLPAIVSAWDAGLLIESKDTEYSTYYNHNKIFQYMAMGKPFVSYEYNKGFLKFNDVAFIAQTQIEYPEMIDLALEKSKLPETKCNALSFALENSADNRAKEFLDILLKL